MLYTNPDNAFLFPSEEAMEEARKNHNDGKPLIQVNLLSYHKNAKYEDENLNTISGEEAYKKYAKVAMKAVTKVGGRFLWYSKVRLTMIGPDLHEWDDVGIVMYPNLDKFVEMANLDWYKASLHHREAGLRDTRLITCYDMPRSIRFQIWLARWFGKFLFR